MLYPSCQIYDWEKTIHESTSIYGYHGSTAQSYSKKYKRTFLNLDTVLGDVNSDGAVNADDANLALLAYLDEAIMQIPMQLDVKQKIAADYNMDGQITADDANAILLRYLDIFMQE